MCRTQSRRVVSAGITRFSRWPVSVSLCRELVRPWERVRLLPVLAGRIARVVLAVSTAVFLELA